jgi:hypothetical protein
MNSELFRQTLSNGFISELIVEKDTPMFSSVKHLENALTIRNTTLLPDYYSVLGVMHDESTCNLFLTDRKH